MTLNRLTRWTPRTLAFAAVLLFAGCLSIDQDQSGIAVLLIVSGNNQSLTVNSTNAAPLVVRALDNSAAPLPGATVTWSITQGTGTVSAATTLTDDAGQTSVTFNPGTSTGTNQIKATAEGLSVTFTIQVAAAT